MMLPALEKRLVIFMVARKPSIWYSMSLSFALLRLYLSTFFLHCSTCLAQVFFANASALAPLAISFLSLSSAPLFIVSIEQICRSSSLACLLSIFFMSLSLTFIYSADICCMFFSIRVVGQMDQYYNLDQLIKVMLGSLIENQVVMSVSRAKRDVDELDLFEDIEGAEREATTPKKHEEYKQYYDAVNSLYEHSIPDHIPCREKEKQVIQEFLESGLARKGCSQTLYISGIPGIGKTICVRDAIDKVERMVKHKIPRMNEFDYVYVNSMNLQKPDKIYSVILHSLLPGLKDVSQAKSLTILNEILSKGQFPHQMFKNVFRDDEKKEIKRKINKTKVIFIDELDYLFTRNEEVMYNLFEWTQSPHSKVIMITTSNTIDFPERLEQKILSRIGNQRLIFRPYTSSEIEEILHERIKNLQIFEKEAIRLIAMKIAKTSSDIRRSLFVLREAIQKFILKMMKEKTAHKLISIEFINETHRQLYKHPQLGSLNQLSDIHKTILNKVCELIKENGKYCWISELFISLLSLHDSRFKQPHVVEEILVHLKDLSILKLTMENRHRDRRVVKTKDIRMHLKEMYIEPSLEISSIINALNDCD